MKFSYNYNEVESSKTFFENLRNKKETLKRLEYKGILDDEDQYPEFQQILPECKILFDSEVEEDEEQD